LYGYDIYLYSYVITLKDAAPWILLKNILRTVGRISFPLFAFCLSEGFSHTSKAYKYGARLAIFALISEIPFDLACFNTPVDFSTQNIFFTLLLGFIGMFIINRIDDEVWILKLFAFIGACFAGHLIRCDYGWKGVALIGGRDILNTEDFLVSNLLLPVGALVYLLFCSFRFGWGFDGYLEEANAGRGIRIARGLRPYFRYVLPLLILVIFVTGLVGK
ncbi:MAG: hypothetical protein II504_04865, partial [Clostridia bacterium]|nr:hypothetical protein [Clostridia bacterium]